jgi:hypothetical protein
MSKSKFDDSSVVELDSHLLAILNQLVAMDLAESWEVKMNGTVDYGYTSTKLMRKLAKNALKHHGSIES